MISDLFQILLKWQMIFASRTRHTQTSAHPQGENFLNTGFTMEGFPSFGAWVTYALGSENEDLPAFVAINDPRGLARSERIILEMVFYLQPFREPISVRKSTC